MRGRKMAQALTKLLSFELLEQLYQHDLYTFRHSMRVADLLADFGDFLDFSKEEIETLYELGIVHDIGKLRIPSTILNKTSPLLPKEKKEIFFHPLYGYSILKDYGCYKDSVLLGVRYHHENIDGSGYPEGLKGMKNIPFFAQMLRIVDSFDAITSKRSYQSESSFMTAIRDLERWKGVWYNPSLLDSFNTMVKKKLL